MRRFQTTTTTFAEIGYSRTKQGICPVCDGFAKRTKRFYQTLNPWNRNPDGSVKTPGDIRAALDKESDSWMREPTYHQKCEPRSLYYKTPIPASAASTPAVELLPDNREFRLIKCRKSP